MKFSPQIPFSKLLIRRMRPTRTTKSPITLRRSFRPWLETLEDRTVPSTFLVSNLNDSGAGSLRAAVQSANLNPGSTIDFANGLHGTIVLTSGELDLTSSTTINGPGASLLAVSGNNASRVLEIGTGKKVSISGLTFTHGHAADQGGGILNDGSNLTLSRDDLTQNVRLRSATDGAAVGASAAWAVRCPSPTVRSPAIRRWAVPARPRQGERSEAESTSCPALQPSPTATSVGTWPKEGAAAQRVMA